MPSIDTRRGLFGSKTVPSAQRSPSLVCSLIETRLVKSRVRVLRDSMISMPRSRATARALTIETPPERIGRSTPAAALAASTSAARLSASAP